MQVIPCSLANGVSAPLLQHYIHDLVLQTDALSNQGWHHKAKAGRTGLHLINILILIGFKSGILFLSVGSGGRFVEQQGEKEWFCASGLDE